MKISLTTHLYRFCGGFYSTVKVILENEETAQHNMAVYKMSRYLLI